MAELGKFFVTVGSKFDKAGFDKARASINQLAKATLAMGTVFAGAMAFATKKAMDLEETTAKFNTVFRGVTKEAGAMADKLVKSYGVSTEESRRFLSGMQDLLVPMGMNRKAAADMSNEIVKLSVDIGSFNNQPTEQVMRDIQSAFNGMPLPMRKYGVNITQARIKQEALNMGLIKTGEKLSVITKAQAVFSLIQADSSDAQDDFARTSEGLANQLKIVKAKFDDLVVAVGVKFLPIAKDYVKLINTNVVPRIKDWIAESGNVEKAIKKTVAVIKFVTRTIFAFVKTVQITVELLKALSGSMTTLQARMLQVGAAMTGNIRLARQFGKIAKESSDKAKKGWDKLTDTVINAGITIEEMNALELESFKTKEDAKEIIKIEKAENEKALLDEQFVVNKERAEAEAIIFKDMQERKKKKKAETEEAIRIEDRRTVDAISRGILMVAELEVLTLRTGVKAFGEAMKQRLTQFIMTKHVELVAAKTVALAKAVFNSATTWGAAAWQIGVIVGQFGAAIGALHAIQRFEKGGIVPGNIGQPQLAVVHGGETITPAGGRGSGNIYITLPPIPSRRAARDHAKIIGDALYNEVKKTRRI